MYIFNPLSTWGKSTLGGVGVVLEITRKQPRLVSNVWLWTSPSVKSLIMSENLFLSPYAVYQQLQYFKVELRGFHHIKLNILLYASIKYRVNSRSSERE